jgi:uncharacterized protein
MQPAPTPAPTLSPASSAPTTGALLTPTQNRITIRKRDGTTVSLAVHVADTPEAQATGLSGRATLAPDAGMLFVFPSAEPIEFWMHDTPLPLSIAFVDDRRTIVDLQEMQPETDDHHVPPGPIRYAIEANRGYFTRAGVTVGDEVDFGALLTSGSASPR